MRLARIILTAALATPAISQNVVQNPTGFQTIQQPSGTTLGVNSLNNALNPLLYPGSDIGAQINYLVRSTSCATGCTIRVPQGSYSFQTPIKLGPNVNLICDAKFSGSRSSSLAALTYTGNGIAIQTDAPNTPPGPVNISGCGLALTKNGQVGFEIYGSFSSLDNFYIEELCDPPKHLPCPTTTGIHVTGQGPSQARTRSGNIRVTNGTLWSFQGTGVYLDQSWDTHLSEIQFSGDTTTTTQQPLVIDSGVGGLYASHFVGNYAGRGVRIQNSETGWSGPQYMNFDQLIVDECLGGDCLSFDSSLYTLQLYATFTNSWFAGAAQNGVHISGGQGIALTAGCKIRSNGTNGILLDSGYVYNVNISNSFVTGNNTSAASDAHGIYATFAPNGLIIANNFIGNVIETSGNQVYGIKINAEPSQNPPQILGNDLYANTAGALSLYPGDTSIVRGNRGTPDK